MDDFEDSFTWNLSDNATTLMDENESSLSWSLIVKLFITLVAVSSIVANVFTSFVILKYEKLRKEVTNILLLHVNTVEMLFLISTTIFMGTMQLGIDTERIISDCMAFELEGALVFCIFLLLIVMATDGCMQTCSRNYDRKFRRICVYLFLAVMYGVAIAAAYFLSHHCTLTSNVCWVTLNFDMYFGLGMLAFVFIMNVILRTKAMCSADRRAAPSTKNVGLAITNIFMLAWTMTVYPALLVAIHADLPVLLTVLINIALTTCLAIPVFKLIYLYRCQDDFNVFLKRAFKCECNDDESEHRREPSVAYNDASGAIIPQRGQVA